MADLSQTATLVVKDANAQDVTKPAGEPVAVGDQVYVSADTVWRALNDTQAHADAKGVALNGGATGQPITYQTKGRINPGAGTAVAVGQLYCVSPNAGKIAPYADVASGRWVKVLGLGVTTALIDVNYSGTPVQKA